MDLDLEFSGPIWHWRGPAPYHFVTVPAPLVEELRDLAEAVSYGWGMVPVTARIGTTTFTTSLWPKDGSYVLPVKDKVRKAENLAVDDVVDVAMAVVSRSPGP